MFSWFRRRHVREEPAKVWLDEAQKFKGILGHIQRLRFECQAILAVAQFPANLARLREGLKERAIPWSAFERHALGRDSSATTGAAVFLAEANRITTRAVPARTRDDRTRISILVIDRYPLPEPETRLREFAASIPVAVSLSFCCSLEDPLIRLFCGPGTLDVITRTMKPDECLEHAMIGKSLVNAQKRIAKKVRREHAAESAQEWFRINLPERRL